MTVSGYNVPMGSQPFALAITGVAGASQHGVIILDRRRYNSSGLLQIQVADTGLDLDHQAVEQVAVRVASSAEPAGEEVMLRETAAGSAIFSGAMRLAPAPALPADGALEVAGSDTITATYVDADDGSGKAATVTKTAVVDNVAPVCSGLGVNGATDTTADVAWGTDEPAGALLRYGPTSALGAEASDSRLLTQHVMRLSALQEDSTYYLTVISTDEAGNSATCSTSFATRSLPPALLVASSVGGVTYRSSTVIYGASTDPSGVASVTVNGIAPSYRTSDGYFEIESPLAVGENIFSVLSSDNLGNTRREVLTVTRLAMSDLLVQSVSGPPLAGQGGSITVTDTVCNNGPGEAVAFAVGFYLSADAGYSADDRFIGSRSVTPLPTSGGCVSASSEVPIPLSAPGGSFYLVACADYRNGVAETDEGNNCRAGTELSLPLPPLNPPAGINVPSSSSTGKLQVFWGSSNVAGVTYILEYSRDGGAWTQVYSGAWGYAYPMLSQNGNYRLRVKAVKSGFADSPYTVSADVCTVFLACGAPPSIAVPASSSTGKLQISWSSSNVTGVTYVLEYSREGGTWTQVYSGTGGYASPVLSQNGNYGFRVKAAKSGFADSPYTASANVCAVSLACGAPPSIAVPASSSTGKLQISWSSSNVTGVTYVLEYSRNGGVWTSVNSGVNAYAYFSASVSGSYSFRVKATKNGFGESGYTTSLPCIVTLM